MTNGVPNLIENRVSGGDMQLIDTTNTRRFAGPDGSVLAIFDQCRAYTIYAPVGVDNSGRICFVGEPRTYWPDEVEEVL